MRRLLAHYGKLPRPEVRGQPGSNHRSMLGGIAGDEHLENRADARAGRIAIAAFLERPRDAVPHPIRADHDVGDGGRAFFGDEELQLARARRAELSLAAQAKLLRILQSQELQRVGSPLTIKVDVHVIAATNRNVRELAARGQFREDLFYRLSMIEIQLPPLADRKEDLPLLQRYFLQHFSTKYNKKLNGISRRTQILLARHSWPGNVRELENVIGNACIMAQGKVVVDTDLPEAIRVQVVRPEKGAGSLTLEEVQSRHLEYVLKLVDGNKARAAELLGVSRATIYGMLARRIRHVDQKDNLSA